MKYAELTTAPNIGKSASFFSKTGQTCSMSLKRESNRSSHNSRAFLLLNCYCPGWVGHEIRRELAIFEGSRDRASMMFQPCFLAVETKERMSAKSVAPCNERKPPEIFCRSFTMRPSRSA